MLIKSVLCIKHMQLNSGLAASEIFLALSKRNRLKIKLASKKNQQKKPTKKCIKCVQLLLEELN